MTTHPLITIGIPAYGRATFLRQAIQSCLNQDYPNLEILISDDASEFDPWPEIADLASPRWTYIRQKSNLGGPGNFNFLIKKAKGSIFILHQDDDMLHPQFCTRAAESLAQYPEAAFYSGLMLRGSNPKGIIGHDIKTFAGPWLPLDYLNAGCNVINGIDGILMLLFAMPFMHPAVAMRSDLFNKIGGYFDEFMFASDNVTLARLLIHGTALYDTRLSGFFRLHKNTSTSTPLQTQYAARRGMLRHLLPEIENLDPNWPQHLERILSGLPRRERWKLLSESIEADLPKIILNLLAASLNKNPKKALFRAWISKVRWRIALKSRTSTLRSN